MISGCRVEPATTSDRWTAMPFRRQLAAYVPGVSGLVRRLDATRRERDRLRAERDRLRTERDRLRADLVRLAADRERLARALEDAEEARIERLGGPSFYATYERTKRVRRLAQRRGGMQHPIWEVNPKDAGRELAASLGIAVPRLLDGPAAPAELTPPGADRFVLKPVGGAAMRGVAVVRREAEDRYRSLFDRRVVTWQELVASAERAVAAGRISATFLVEELVPGRGGRWLPFDWKCYCIGGRVQVVLQKDLQDQRYPSRARFKFWDRDVHELGPVRNADRYDATLPAPVDAAALVEAAERVAAHLPGPFVRVDLYEGPHGPVFGEVTPHPGGRQLFSEPTDRRLGEAWERYDAERLAARIASRPSIR